MATYEILIEVFRPDLNLPRFIRPAKVLCTCQSEGQVDEIVDALTTLAAELGQKAGPVEPERDMKKECWTCCYRERFPGSRHITCCQPDPKMKGDPYGLNRSWFTYPEKFDPVWKTKLCANYSPEIDERR